jgi:hypothetical protein
MVVPISAFLLLPAADKLVSQWNATNVANISLLPICGSLKTMKNVDLSLELQYV